MNSYFEIIINLGSATNLMLFKVKIEIFLERRCVHLIAYCDIHDSVKHSGHNTLLLTCQGRPEGGFRSASLVVILRSD